MPVFNNILAGASAQGGSYHIEQSAVMQRDYHLETNSITSTNVWTFSGWVKPVYDEDNYGQFFGLFGSEQCMMSINDFKLLKYSGSGDIGSRSERRFRDCSAWYHIHASANGGTRGIEVRVNGKHLANLNSSSVSITSLLVGARTTGGADRFKGMIAEVFLLPGQFIDYDEFGEFDKNEIWIPKDAASSITFGSEAVYLKFDDKTNLGKDSSGQSNNMSVDGTVTNNSAAAYANSVLCLDTPTNNFSIYNVRYSDVNNSYQNFNDSGMFQARTHDRACFTTIPLYSGKWYFEAIRNDNDASQAGIASEDLAHKNNPNSGSTTATPTFGAQMLAYAFQGARLKTDQGDTSYGSSLSSSLDVLNVAFDLDARKIWFGKNGSWFSSGDPANGTNPSWDGNSGENADGEWHKVLGGNEGNALVDAVHQFWIPYTSNASTGWTAINMGQAYVEGGQREPDPTAATGAYSFKYTPPSGFKAISTKNLPDVTVKKPSDHVDFVSWTGNPSSPPDMTNSLDFRPDLLMIHQNTGDGHSVKNINSCDGTGVVATFLAEAAATGVTDCVTAFNDKGFTLGADASDRGINGENGTLNQAWCFKAGGAPTATNTESAGSAQTAGSVKVDGSNGSFAHGTIAVDKMSVNTTAGFSIVKYTGTGSAGTVPHGLGADPQLIMFRRIDGDHSILWTGDMDDVTHFGSISANSGNSSNANMFTQNTTNLTNNTFHVGTDSAVNPSSQSVTAFCWTPINGYSAFGHFHSTSTSDGSHPDRDSDFVYTGFKPGFLMLKRKHSTTGEWLMFNNKQVSSHTQFNYKDNWILPSASSNYSTGNSYAIDFYANGFKIRNSQYTNILWDGDVHYLAWAESPFGGANVNPCPAQ